MTSAREGSNSPSPRYIKLLRGIVGSISIGQIVVILGGKRQVRRANAKKLAELSNTDAEKFL